MRIKDIKTKQPWRRVRPDGYANHGMVASGVEVGTPMDNLAFDIMTQADFLREYYPSGHAINNPAIYPDIYREEKIPILDENGDDTGRSMSRFYREPVPRVAFAFQQLVTVKHLVHLCGNDIQFELKSSKVSDLERSLFFDIRTGWLEKDMDIAFYESAKSVKITGDVAFVGYLRDGKFQWKTLSYLNGDTLFPHFDPITGKLLSFARSFLDYTEDGNASAEWVEVWDDTYLYRFKQNVGKSKNIKDKMLNLFGLEGYSLESKKPHGFSRIPISYYRDNDGPCWAFSQSTIEEYEVSFSQMAHNNQTYGVPILVLMGEGDGMDIMKDMNGSIKSISMSQDDKVDYLQAQSASESYMKQLEMLYKMIFTQSHIVEPPELKSGDLPAAALKILYSPAYEKAINDAKMYQSFLNDMVEIFRYGYGLERERTLDFMNLPMKWWIEPYVHVNSSTVMADLAAAVQNGFLSRQTASERIETLYATNSEWDRIMREIKEQQEADLLYQLKMTEQNEPTNKSADK